MAGITSYGAYIPLYRLSRAEIAKAWGSASSPGEKAVASYDEDSITMAVAASLDCIKGIDAQKVDGLYFASTTSPYKEKQAATTVAAALGLRREIHTADFSGSLRSGTIALRAALDAVSAGSAKSILVTAAETRLGAPKGEKEAAFGDGAAAVLVTGSGNAAEVEGSYTVFDEFFDMWRSGQDTFVRSGEDRFLREAGYTRVVLEAVSAALKKCNLKAKDFAKAALYAPNPGQITSVARAVGFDPATQVQDLLYNTVGNTGTALSLMLLVAALEEAKAGDRLLLGSYGDGCDVIIMKVTEGIGKITDRRGIKCHLASKRMLPNYQKYLLWRELLETEPPPRPPLPAMSVPALWRDRELGLPLHGSRCKRCGTPQYPVQRICTACQAEDEYEPYSFVGRKAKIFTFCHDNLAAALDPPSTVTAVDFEGGGRIMCDMTDRVPEEVKTDMPVEMTFRRIHYVAGIYNYWWKSAPIRC